jgi:hypothetical protein
LLAVSLGMFPGVAFAQGSTTIVQAGSGLFEGFAAYQGVHLASLKFGMGGDVAVSGGGADGDLSCTLIGRNIADGLPRQITLEGKIGAGGVSPAGVVTVSGTGSVDPGDGSPILTGIAFNLNLTPDTEGRGILVLIVDATALKAAVVTHGGMTSSSCKPPELGPSLRLPDRNTLVWTASAVASSYRLYRGTVTTPWAFDHACFASSLVTAMATDATLPAVGQGFYYLVSAVNACGEGSLGVTTNGPQVPNTAPCP